LLAGKRHLLIVPAGPLSSLPFRSNLSIGFISGRPQGLFLKAVSTAAREAATENAGEISAAERLPHFAFATHGLVAGDLTASTNRRSC
jgi:hypothetical protein